MIQFSRPDGQTAPGFLAEPGGNPPSVVLIQEWWGVNEPMKSVARRLAAEGYRTLVPDLYRGRQAATADEADHMMSALDWADATHQDLQGAAQHLARENPAVGILGFCMGGALAIAGAVHVPELRAGVCFYGIPPAELADPAAVRIPMLAHFATRDDWCNPSVVGRLEETWRDAGVDYELHWYEAQHAFFNEARPEVYDPRASAVAWERTLAFLGSRLG